MLTITWGDHEFDLFCQRAVHWRAGGSLIIADPHLGKAAAFRHHGIPVPEGGTRADLARLSSLLDVTRAQRLIILGDFLHARAGRAHEVLSAIAQWRDCHSALKIILVRGNHDKNAGDPPTSLNFSCVDEPFKLDDFQFVHDPATACGFAQSLTFAGHLHPCAILHDLDGSALRAPCFHFSDSLAVLPAFGSFTGMHPVRPRYRKNLLDGTLSHDRIFAVGPHEVVEIRTLRLSRAKRA